MQRSSVSHSIGNTGINKWEYTSAAEERVEAGCETMELYIWKRQKTVTHYITTRSLLELCEAMERTLGARAGIWWGDQVGINLEGSK